MFPCGLQLPRPRRFPTGFDGLFLAGTYNRGTQDWWSDLDYIAAAKPEHATHIADVWLKIARKVHATGAYLAAGERGQY